MSESGYELSELARRLHQPLERLESWIEGADQPTSAQLRALAKMVWRPSALFYLPQPPRDLGVPPSLRNAPGLLNRKLSPEEIKAIRWLTRVQRTLSWLQQEDRENPGNIDLPVTETGADPVAAAMRFRKWVDVPIEEQLSWPDARRALKAWRDALNACDIAVFQFQINKEAIRGFSIWDDRLPLVALNTSYTPQARIYTLFHEVGHLLRRSEGACATFTNWKSAQLERWCEQFAAAFLLPGDELTHSAEALYDDRASDDQRYEQVKRLARRFKTSVRATGIRLVELGLAGTDLNAVVMTRAASSFDDFPRPSGGGGGRRAEQIRLQNFGAPTITALLGGIDSGRLTARDVGDYLRLSPRAVSDLESLISAP